MKLELQKFVSNEDMQRISANLTDRIRNQAQIELANSTVTKVEVTKHQEANGVRVVANIHVVQSSNFDRAMQILELLAAETPKLRPTLSEVIALLNA